jgi:uncharacterized SAM-binding protein YcdF (DUF218 family)
VFFVLSKTLGVIALPTNFLMVIGILGVILLAMRFAALGGKLMVAAIAGLAICGFSPLGSILLYPLEQRFPPCEARRAGPDGIIVLGGPIDADLSAALDRPVVRSSPDRLLVAAALARRFPNARVVYSGGSGDLFASDAREADFAAEIFESLGIDKARLIMERHARNTYENAAFTKALVAPVPGERWLLVTSAFHMPRAVGLFRKAGFAVEPCPVDWRVGGRADFLRFTNLAGDGWGRTDTALREWMGLVAYRLTGKTDALLPGPAEGSMMQN